MGPLQIQPSLVTTSTPLDPVLVLEKLQQQKPYITFVRFQWVDYAGVLRVKVLVIEACLEMVANGKYLHAPPMVLHCAADSTLLPGTNYPGVHWLVPDWSSLKLTPSPATAIVMCGVMTQTTLSSPMVNADLCPRRALVKVVELAARTWQLDFLVGLEVEFQVMKLSENPEEGMVPYSRGLGHFAAAGLLDECWPYVEECVQKLRSLGVHVNSLHAEGLCGQYEITLGPLPPLQAVDQLVVVHSVLKHTFNSHGYTVTMSPKPTSAAPEQMNGQHVHLSMQSVHQNLEDSFLAGILKRLPNMWAFFLPQKVSYERVAPWMAGDTIGWGTENRTVPVRKIESNHWEIRSIDATANMYLTLAAVLSAGLLGLDRGEPLTWPDLTFAEGEIRGDSLPRSLDESLSVLDSDSGGLDTMLNERLIQHYVDMKRYELSRVEQMGSEKARNLMIQLF